MIPSAIKGIVQSTCCSGRSQHMGVDGLWAWSYPAPWTMDREAWLRSTTLVVSRW
jgi:hypothetical protein